MHLYQILSDPKFWDECPEWADLKEEGQKAHREVVDRVLSAKPGEDCAGCSNIKAVLRPFQSKFMGRIGAWLEDDLAKLDSLVTYITKKRGYRPKAIVVYYKNEEGQNRTAKF